ncbi:MAG TPA: ABC transporter permease [Candidatus Corynebacterium avicola]|uniref:ABC transporter permease n=1 Tax=Candidatus Corynebacterium avicola TaxID=2838527 RepID=A0A9D1RPS9_9CORY|nr:ABC transporter permease [Candidatus Corynebacterium avicola]
MSTHTTSDAGYSRAGAVRTVVGREIQVALKSTSLIATFVITLVVVLGAIFVINYLSGRDSDDPELVVTGTDSAVVSKIAGDTIDVSDVDNRDAAVAAVEDGKDAALVFADGQFELISDGAPDASISASAQAAASAIAQNEALRDVGVDPADFAEAMPDATVETIDVSSEAQEDRTPAIVTTMLGFMVVIMFIMTFAGSVGGRVTEEKSSRVVEIILATMRPIDLLIGKVLAMLIVGFIGTVVILGAAVAAMGVTGMLAEVDLDPSTLGILLISFILGMLFFSSMYAAAGSLVSKADELGSTQMPVMLMFFAVMYPPLLGWSALDSTPMQIMAWVPPLSLGTAPMQFAAGNFSALELIASLALFAVMTFLILLMVARIYRGSILNNGSKMSWRAAFSSGSNV